MIEEAEMGDGMIPWKDVNDYKPDSSERVPETVKARIGAILSIAELGHSIARTLNYREGYAEPFIQRKQICCRTAKEVQTQLEHWFNFILRQPSHILIIIYIHKLALTFPAAMIKVALIAVQPGACLLCKKMNLGLFTGENYGLGKTK